MTETPTTSLSITKEIERLQRRKDYFTAILCCPGAMFLLLLTLGFHAYGPGAIPSSLIDAMLNFLALGMLVSLVGIPVGLIGRARASDHLEELSTRALHSPTERVELGPTLRVGSIRARVAADGTLLLIRRMWPSPMRWLTNSAMLASAFGMFGTMKLPSPLTAAAVWMFLILAVIFAIPWAMANWVSVTRIRSNGLELQETSTDGPWKFGPIRWRSRTVPLPCFAVVTGARLSISNGERYQQIATLPESNYGRWQGARLRAWLEEMLQMSLSQNT